MASPAGSREEATANLRQISSKKAAPTAPITSFFKPVSEGTHKLNDDLDHPPVSSSSFTEVRSSKRQRFPNKLFLDA